MGHDKRCDDPDEHADNATRKTQHHGLDQELEQNVPASGAKRATQADLSHSLPYGHQHDGQANSSHR